MRSTRSVLAVVLSILVVAPSLSAQVHVAGPQALDAVVQQHVSATPQDCETVRLFLDRRQARAIWGQYGGGNPRAANPLAEKKPADPRPSTGETPQAVGG